MEEIRPYGSWESPIGSADLVRGALRLSAPRIERGQLYWLEGRAGEGGRQVVVFARLSGSASGSLSGAREATPAGVNVRTRVHEYGGGEYAVWRDRIFFVDDADGQIHAGHVAGAALPITKGASQYADLVVSPDGRWLLAIEERPRDGAEPENRLIAISIRESDAGSGVEAIGAPLVVASGHDFYASPTIAPEGDRIAFLAWDHPDMPWNATLLEMVRWGDAGPLGQVRIVAGSSSESLFQPRFSQSGALYFVSDRTGWWNLMRLGGEGSVAVTTERSEIGRPQWVFGQSSWSFLDARTVLASTTIEGSDSLVRIDLENGSSRPLSTGFNAIDGVQTGEGWATCIAGSAHEASALFAWRADTDAPERIRESAPISIPSDVISVGVPREFASADGRTTHAFIYLPRSEKNPPGRSGERPPLLVKSHGGPTSATSAALDPRIQYWTSRGFAVADVNYAGSTGYGRAYRDLLEQRWGIVDVEDCVAVARALASEGEVDRDRLAISGGSAGGYTTLCALTFHDIFAAGASHYGIGDLEALARDTHKFESRYTDWLVGPLPEMRDRYIERSPVHHPERLGCPIIFFQGLEDKVVPPNQAEAMIAVLARRGIPHAYVPFEGEQHGFRRAENIRTAIDGELYFYSQLFAFEAPRPERVRVVAAEA